VPAFHERLPSGLYVILLTDNLEHGDDAGSMRGAERLDLVRGTLAELEERAAMLRKHGFA